MNVWATIQDETRSIRKMYPPEMTSRNPILERASLEALIMAAQELVLSIRPTEAGVCHSRQEESRCRMCKDDPEQGARCDLGQWTPRGRTLTLRNS